MVKERVDIFTASDKIKSVIDSCISKEHFDGVEKMQVGILEIPLPTFDKA